MKQLQIECHALSHVGGRSHNEDSVLCVPEEGFAVVADGMGGYEGGEVASRIAVQSCARELRELPEPALRRYAQQGRTRDECLLLALAARAHEEVRAARRAQLALSHMGSTLVACLLRGERGTVVHVGDSRAYLLRAGKLHPLTRDHSLLEEVRAAGDEQTFSVVQSQYAHVLTRALGVAEGVAPDVRSLSLEEGDRLLLCSDGLHGPLHPDAVEALLRNEPEAPRCCQLLVEAALCAGGTDNITVALLDVRKAA